METRELIQQIQSALHMREDIINEKGESISQTTITGEDREKLKTKLVDLLLLTEPTIETNAL